MNTFSFLLPLRLSDTLFYAVLLETESEFSHHAEQPDSLPVPLGGVAGVSKRVVPAAAGEGDEFVGLSSPSTSIAAKSECFFSVFSSSPPAL